MSPFALLLLLAAAGASVFLWRRGMAALDAANEAEWGSRWFNRIDGLNRLLCRRYHRLVATPLALPETGPVLVAANHISGLDAFLLIAASRRPLRFLIATEQYRRFGLRWLFRAAGCIPVDRRGRPEQAYREALRALAAGEVVALFPHGGIHLEEEPPKPLKGGVVRLALSSGCDIHPVRIEGIRGRGHVALALFLRGHPRLTVHPPLRCSAQSASDCLVRLDSLLRGIR